MQWKLYEIQTYYQILYINQIDLEKDNKSQLFRAIIFIFAKPIKYNQIELGLPALAHNIVSASLTFWCYTLNCFIVQSNVKTTSCSIRTFTFLSCKTLKVNTRHFIVNIIDKHFLDMQHLFIYHAALYICNIAKNIFAIEK